MIKKALVTLACPLFIYASSVDFKTSLTKTLENNKSLKAKKLDIEHSKLTLDEAKGYDFGNLVFAENISRTNNAGYVFGMKLASREANFNDFGFDEFLAQMGNIGTTAGQQALLATEPENLNYPESRTNYETKVTYQMPIFTGYKISSAKKMAKLQILANEAKYKFDEKALGLEVLKAYNGAVAAKEFIKATKKAKEATSSFVDFANELYKEGLVTNIDVKQASVYDMGVDAKMIEAQNQYELALSYLRFLTDESTISDVLSFQNVNFDLEEVQIQKENLFEQRDDYVWMKHNTQTMKEKIDYDSSSKYPTIGAQVEYGFNNDIIKVHDISEKDYYLGAIGLSYTLFDGSVTNTKEQKAKIEYKKTQHYLEYMQDGINLEIEKNLLNLKAKRKILNQKQKALSLSDEVLVQSSEMYKNHLINMSELLVQQANQQKASAEAIFAKYEESIASATLMLSVGKSLERIGE